MGAIDNYLAGSVSPTGFTTFCPSNEDILASSCKVLIVGPYNSTASPPSTTLNTPVKVSYLDEATAFYGNKTAIYRAIDKALCACTTGVASIYALALPVPVSAISAVYNLTITGPALQTHTKTITILGKSYYLLIPQGSTVATIAAILKSELDNDPTFPFEADVTLTGLTLTASDPGIFGNGLTLTTTDSRGLGQTDTTFTLSVTTAGAGSLDAASIASALGTCSYKCVAIMDDSQSTVDSVQAWVNTKGACGPDYTGVMGWFARKETKGSAIAFGNGITGVSQPYNQIIVGLHMHTSMPYFPYDAAVTRAVMSCCLARDNPGNPIQNAESRMLCLPFDKGCTNFYSRDEINQLFTAGWTVLDSINGYIGLEVERTFHRLDDQGRPTIAYSDPTQIRILDYWYNGQFRPWLLENYGSSILFKDGTTIPLRTFSTDAPAFLQSTKSVTPSRLRGAIVAFMETFKGVIFDEQDLSGKVYAYSDDQLRAICQGDPRVLVVFFDRVSVARPLRHVFLNFSYTTRTC